ncbi:DEAD/DEAH box helicase [Virgibacillus salinus]|uniref:Superfamily II DNA or RNA helicase n=1 Tax=Virgibacillus salinus TaxID=553311 RepID=A0A1H1ETU4_9BACI|nr:DEAD/DEAH box helicase [Virgibacillus salinus]SDQ91939.1 Superfamily II DNA or RNA helicase [Virgibacillus salinus]
MNGENKLIVNTEQTNLLKEITSSLETCQKFYFSVAFVNFSGLQLLLDALKETKLRGVKGKVMTSTYLNFTDPKALDKLREFNNVDLKVFVTDRNVGFHTKAYIFEYEDYFKVMIGSSNITQSALKSNVEWNVEIISKNEETFIQQVISEFNGLWDRSTMVDDFFIQDYKRFFNNIDRVAASGSAIYEKAEYIVPNSMQNRAMENLQRLRGLGEKKALVIAATGTGKTYMSAFDVRNLKPKKLLFVVHREEILTKAKETYEKLLPNEDITFGMLTGTKKDFDADYVFATIQTLSRYYQNFDRGNFDYIIYDEAHHATADTYQHVIEYFEPDFMLGMTATPERGDSRSIFEIFDFNVALEVRLHDALEDDIVVPFHYFGITDIDEIDLSDVSVDDLDEITKRLKVNERVDFIIEKMRFYGHDGKVRKCLGFCASREHARYMAEEFNRRGIPSTYLTGEDSVKARELRISELEDEENELQVIFTVDIFNEGVDIPSVNTVLMLRPTNSPIVFIQQLGRGLRKYQDKSFLTVLDLIGNHTKTFLIAIALNGSRYYDKESLKVAISTGFAHLPGATHIQMDKISQERILAQIDQEKFTSMKYLKEEYFEFKKMNQGRVPDLLMDYYKYDGAPDPVRFIVKEKSYLNFVAKVEKDQQLNQLLANETFEKTLKWLSGMLPLKRIYDFIIINYLIENQSITFDQAKHEILKWVKKIDDDSTYHAMEFLNQNFFDDTQKNRTPKLAKLDGEQLSRTVAFEELLANPNYARYLIDLVDYGLFRYEREFGGDYYGVPHFKLYEQYQMMDAALLSNYRKSHSSYRGSGLLSNGNDYFLYIDLHKEADIKESINYNDKFIDRKHLQWETQNNTSQSSERGKNIIFNQDRGINLHLFVRKYKEIEKNNVEPYIYIGEGNTISYNGERPIEVQLELEHIIPPQLYTELTEKV